MFQIFTTTDSFKCKVQVWSKQVIQFFSSYISNDIIFLTFRISNKKFILMFCGKVYNCFVERGEGRLMGAQSAIFLPAPSDLLVLQATYTTWAFFAFLLSTWMFLFYWFWIFRKLSNRTRTASYQTKG